MDVAKERPGDLAPLDPERIPAELRNFLAAGCFGGVALAAAGCLLSRLLAREAGLIDAAWILPSGAAVVLARGAWRVRPQRAADRRFAIGLFSAVLAQGIVWLAQAVLLARAVVGTRPSAEQDLRRVVGGVGILLNIGALIAVAGLPGGAVRRGWLVAGEIAWLVAGPLFVGLGPVAMT